MLSAFGAYPSRASTDPSRGKPLKAVFAARSSTQAVAAWMMKNGIEPMPKVAAATWAMRLGCGWFSQSNPTRLHGFSE